MSLKESSSLQTKLEKLDTYFITWFKKCHLRPKQLKCLARNLCGDKPCYSEKRYKKYFSQRWNIDTLERSIYPLVEAFLSISFGKAEDATNHVSFTEKIAEHCVANRVFSDEYAEGTRYLCNLTKIHTKLKIETSDKGDYEVFSSCSFDDLTNEGKIMVLLAKWNLYNKINHFEDCILTLKQIRSLDAKNWVWAYKLVSNVSLLPTEDEIRCAVQAMELSRSTKQFPLCVSLFFKMLADVLTHKIRNNLPNTIIILGNGSFTNYEAAISFIKTEERKILADKNAYNASKIAKLCADVFSKKLPLQLKLQESSNDKQSRDKTLNDEHKQLDYGELIGRIYMLLKSHMTNTKELNYVFEKVWASGMYYWNEYEQYSLHFLHGCYFSMKEDLENALMHWLQMMLPCHTVTELETSSLFLYIDFVDLIRINIWNDWPQDVNLNLHKVDEEIAKRLSEENRGPLEKQKLRLLKFHIEDALKFEYNNSNESGSNGRIDDKSQINLKMSDVKSDHQNISKEGTIHAVENFNLLSDNDKKLCLMLQKKLKKCDNYFVKWFGAEVITKEELVVMTAWLYNKCNHIVYHTEEKLKEHFSVYTMTTFENIIYFLLEAFLNISCGNAYSATKNILLVDYLIKHCVEEKIFSVEYTDGIGYLCRLARFHMDLKWAIPLSLSKKDYNGLLSEYYYNTLTNKGKVMVLLAEYCTFDIRKIYTPKASKILEKMITLDPENGLWKSMHFNHVQLGRKRVEQSKEDSIKDLIISTEITPLSKYPFLNVCKLCQKLAQMLTHRVHNNLPNADLYNFKSNEKAVEFIKKEARKALTNFECKLDPEIINKYLAVFKHGLPFQLRDIDMIEEFQDALDFGPEQLGNYQNVIDIIDKLLQSPKHNAKRLDFIFENVFKQKGWTSMEQYSLHFLSGCHLFMQDNIQHALMQWLQMDSSKANFSSSFRIDFYYDFGALSRIKDRHHWSNNLDLNRAHEIILERSQILSRETVYNNNNQGSKNHLKDLRLNEKSNKLRLRKLQFAVKAAIKTRLKNQDIKLEQEVNSKNKSRKNYSPCYYTSCLTTELNKKKYYFIKWLGDYSITAEKLTYMTNSLYKVDGRSNGLSEEEFKEKFSRHTMTTLQRIISPLVEAFLNIEIGNTDGASKNISWVESVVEHCMNNGTFSEEYAEGIEYLCGLLKFHKNLRLQDVTKSEYETFKEIHFKTLPKKGKSMVFVAKWLLNEQIPDRRNNSVLDLKKVITYDADNCSWNYLLCGRLRFLRRQNGFEAPDENEINAIVKAVELSTSTQYNAMCVSGFCQCLADIISCRFNQRVRDGPLNVGDYAFESNSEIIEYIKNQARDAFKRKSIGYLEKIMYAEIFSTLLPFGQRDYNLAEKCYKLCLQTSPSDSKANHKMGLLQLTGKGDITQSIHFFNLAVKFEPKNYPAWIDLIQTLLSAPNENTEAIDKVFQTFWNYYEYWNENAKFSMHFLEGCYLAMTDKIEKAVSHWTKYNSHKSSSDRATDFNNWQRVAQRHKWKIEESLNFEEILNEILRKIHFARDEKEREKLDMLKSKVKNEIYKMGCKYHGGSTAGSAIAINTPYYHQIQSSSVADKDSSWRTSKTEASSDAADSFPSEETW